MEKITLSPSSLSVLRDCPRCFWDAEVLGIKPPRGIFPSLPGGIDLVLKKFFDKYRGGMPPMLRELIPGVLYVNQETMKKWRYWKTAPRYFDPVLNVEVYGAIDDLVLQDACHVPLDYKTKGSEPKDDGSQYYMTQMDIYNLLFKHNDRAIKEKAYVVYVWPKEAKEAYGEHDFLLKDVIDIPFRFKVFEYKCSSDRAVTLIERAVNIIRGERPQPSETCERCAYEAARSKIHEIKDA